MTTKYQAGTRVSEYVLEECLGAGSFGEVWKARHHIWPDTHVAVKLPTEPDYVRYLRREGVMVHGLRHPNIVRVLGLDPYADIPYLVMELVQGPALKQVLAENPQGVAVSAAQVILRGVLEAMVAAHAANILHRDLKPGNVLLNLAGRPLSALAVADVKVGDFGLGMANQELLDTVAQSASIARDERLVGTINYMAPEVRDGERPADARSDLYAVGVILFELLTGDRPAGAELPSTLRSEVPAALDEIFRNLYARYERRFESAAAVLAELERFERGAAAIPAGRAAPPPLPARLPPPLPDAARRSCPVCSASTQPADQFCDQCGAQLVARVRQCSGCLYFPAPDDVYCILCGHPLPTA